MVKLFGCLFLLLGVAHGSSQPIADIHLHWKWNQKEVTSVSQAINHLESNNITLAVVSGTPPELALELADAAPEIVIPVYGPYRIPGEWSLWHRDPKLIARVRAALASGKYKGIGEIHMIGGFISHWKKPEIAQLFELAAEYDVPVLVHTEFSRADYTLGFCQAHPKTRFLLAHAGSMLKPAEVRRILDGCANLHIELSARDPWRHRSNPLTEEDGQLKSGWRQLIMDFSDRVMVGSDPVWPVDRLNPWDEPDTGWEHLGRFIDFHRSWLAELPAEVAQKIRLDNALTFFAKR